MRKLRFIPIIFRCFPSLAQLNIQRSGFVRMSSLCFSDRRVACKRTVIFYFINKYYIMGPQQWDLDGYRYMVTMNARTYICTHGKQRNNTTAQLSACTLTVKRGQLCFLNRCCAMLCHQTVTRFSYVDR